MHIPIKNTDKYTPINDIVYDPEDIFSDMYATKDMTDNRGVYLRVPPTVIIPWVNGKYIYTRVTVCDELQKLIDDYRLPNPYYLELIVREGKLILVFIYENIIGSKMWIYLDLDKTRQQILKSHKNIALHAKA